MIYTHQYDRSSLDIRTDLAPSTHMAMNLLIDEFSSVVRRDGAASRDELSALGSSLGLGSDRGGGTEYERTRAVYSQLMFRQKLARRHQVNS